MNWMSIGKGVVCFVASAGVGTVVTNVVKATMPANVSTMNKVLTVVGGFVLSSMVGAVASQYVAAELNGVFPDKQVKPEVTNPG